MIKENLIILSGKGCPGCRILERKLGDKVPVYDITENNDAYNLAQKEEILAVPTVMYKDNGKWNKCRVYYEDGKVVIGCKDKKFEFEEKE